MRKTFVVGKLLGRRAEILLLSDEEAPAKGARVLDALVRSLAPHTENPLPCPTTIH